jgi:uncharacterized protein
MKLDVLPPSPWYAEGLAFSCTQCGNCCTGGPGYVWITDEEIARLAEYLKLSVAETTEKYCRTIDGKVSLRERRSKEGLYDCIFLTETGPAQNSGGVSHGRRVCSVYSVRPAQCRTWPFWKENLASESAWVHAAKRCPGIGKGPRYGLSKIESIRDSDE